MTQAVPKASPELAPFSICSFLGCPLLSTNLAKTIACCWGPNSSQERRTSPRVQIRLTKEQRIGWGRNLDPSRFRWEKMTTKPKCGEWDEGVPLVLAAFQGPHDFSMATPGKPSPNPGARNGPIDPMVKHATQPIDSGQTWRFQV